MEENLQELEKKYQMSDFPLNIVIEICNTCNLNCIMCSNDKLKRKRGFLSVPLYKKMIDEIAIENPYTRIWLDFYGEPLLIGYKLYYMIDYAKKKGLRNININTNGTLLSQEMADMLLDSGIDFISVDCYGFYKNTFEKICVGADRDVVYKNIEYLLESKKKRANCSTIVEVKTMWMEQNEGEVPLIVDYWQKKGAWISIRKPISWAGQCTDFIPKVSCDRIACGKAVGILPITWDGNAVNCIMDVEGEYVYGNVMMDSLKDIWKKRNEKMVQMHMEHRFDALPDICRQCNDWIIVGEEHYDDKGRTIVKSYESKQKMM